MSTPNRESDGRAAPALLDRSVAVAGLRNIRDLGGLRAGQRRVRPGVLFRSEAPIGLGPAGLSALGDIGIRTVVDLRDQVECGVGPATTPPEVLRIHVPVATPSDATGTVSLLDQLLAGDLPSFSATDLGATYVRMLDDQAEAFGKAVAVLADPRHWPVLVHCVAGKDRTGLACALLLAAVGVDEDEIIGDYVLTTATRASRLDEFRPSLQALGVSVGSIESLFGAPAEALEGTFAALHDRYGGAAQYLVRRAGVGAEQLRSLQDHLLVPAGD